MTVKALPEVRMGSYLAFEALRATPEIRDGLVPVRVDPIEPVMPLSYEPEVCGMLVPEGWMLGEWPHLSISYQERLDGFGLDRVAGELRAISERHGGKGLCLLDHDSPWRSPDGRGQGHGDTTPRVVFAEWWESKTGEPVPELLPNGTTVRPAYLPGRVRPVAPKDWRQDRRWRDAPDVPWPPTEADVSKWVEGVYWQTARSRHNPHQYNVRDWGPKLPFLRVVQWIREAGETELWGGETYRYKRIGDFKYWSMGATLPSTVILNRKPWGQDPGDRDEAEKAAPTTEAAQPAEAPLFDKDGKPLSLAERINAEHRACSLAVGAALRHAVRCGGLLREAKAQAGHGNWLGWLEANFEGSPRTAQAYMKMHRETTLRGANTQHAAHSAELAARRETA